MRQVFLNRLLPLILFSGFVLGSSGVYVYVIPFENVKNDAAISWLSEGFVEMVMARLDQYDDIYLKDQAGLEEVMANRTLLLQQRRGTKNLLLLGKYERALNKVSVSVQLVDISTWDELDRRKISGDYNDVKSLNAAVTEMVRTMLSPYLPVRKPSPYPALIKGKGMRKEPTYGSRAIELSHSIDVAVDILEEKMDLSIGARGEPDKNALREVDGEWILDISMDPYKRDNPENQANTSIMVSVLNTLMENPYNVRLSKPRFEFNPENRQVFNVVLPVNYSLKGHIIKDMLSSLPYSGLKQEGSLTIFYFNRDKYNFPADISEKIRYGQHRIVPVIQFLDDAGRPVALLVDSPEMATHERTSDRIIYKPFHYFAPLINFTIGGWSMQVALETVDIPVEYSFSMDIETARKISRVSLKFVPENELSSLLDQVL